MSPWQWYNGQSIYQNRHCRLPGVVRGFSTTQQANIEFDILRTCHVIPVFWSIQRSVVCRRIHSGCCRNDRVIRIQTQRRYLVVTTLSPTIFYSNRTTVFRLRHPDISRQGCNR